MATNRLTLAFRRIRNNPRLLWALMAQMMIIPFALIMCLPAILVYQSGRAAASAGEWLMEVDFLTPKFITKITRRINEWAYHE